MNANRNRNWLLAAGGIIAIAAVGAIVWFFVPSLHPKGTPRPIADYYPTSGWRTSTPEEQGFDSGKLAEMLNGMGVSSRDLVAILQAIKEAGALQAELRVL